MKKAIGILLWSAIALAALLGIAGTAAWWNVWAFLAFMGVTGAATHRLIQNAPGLAEERRTAAAQAPHWDVNVVRMVNLALPVMLVVAALDMRFRWFPPVSAAVSMAALAAMIPAAMLTYRAMAANLFFSSHVHIQQDRGHVVVSTGPYRLIRHPGYTGAVLFNLLAPLALGAWAAWVPGIGTALLLIFRTAREDRFLMAELPGYSAYAAKVPHRLAPGIW